MYKFNYDNDKSDKNDIFNKKLKYTDLSNRNKTELLLKPKNQFIQDENSLIFPKDKKFKKTENLSEINSDNMLIRIDGVDTGAGRGFGNLNVSNNIRTGQDSRLHNNKFKKIKEAEVIDRFEFIEKDIQNPNNLILPFPRGGEITRKKPLIKKELDDKKFNFKY